MLDFYIIDDQLVKPNDPEKSGLEYVGGLDYKTFDNLQNKGIIGKQFDFYSDFRLETALIRQIRQIILDKHLQTDTDAKKLIQLLDIADQKQSGLLTYGD